MVTTAPPCRAKTASVLRLFVSSEVCSSAASSGAVQVPRSGTRSLPQLIDLDKFSARKPSHFGSYDHTPASTGTLAWALASIGSNGGITGRSTVSILT